jgi:hypothetical protein
MTQSDPRFGWLDSSWIASVTTRPSKTSRLKVQPKPQWGHVVRRRSTCQGLDLSGLRASVRAPTGQTKRHSPQEMQFFRSVGSIRASMPVATRSSTDRPDISLHAWMQRRQRTQRFSKYLIRGVA